MGANVQVSLGRPVIVAQASPDVKGWGPWQFPFMERLADGAVYLEYHVEADSATAYGLPTGKAVSSDRGKTWKAAQSPPAAGGIALANGDRVAAFQLPSPKTSELALGEPAARMKGTYGDLPYEFYPAGQFPRDLRGWRLRRLARGASQWREESADVNIPGELMYTVEGVLVIPAFDNARLRAAPDGSLWNAVYGVQWLRDGRPQEKLWNTMFLRSADCGRNWEVLSTIPYRPDATADPHAELRDGFTEPEYNFMPDGSVLALLRTHDGNGVGPMYWIRSTDLGRTWSRPAVFDTLGVWPQLLTLDCGVTLASYGRPGVFVRATADPAGLEWGSKVAVLEGDATCSYTELIALDARTALLAYSDFLYPDAAGRKCKTILVRRVEVG